MAELCLFDFRGKKVYPCKCHWYEVTQSWPKVQQAFLDYDATVLLQKSNTSMKYHAGNHLAEFGKEDQAQCFTAESCQCHLKGNNMAGVLKVCYGSNCSDHCSSKQSKVSEKEEFVEHPLDGDMLLSTSSEHGGRKTRLNVQGSVVGHKGKDLRRLEGQNARDDLGIKANLISMESKCNFIDLTFDESDSSLGIADSSESGNDTGDSSESGNDTDDSDDCCADEESGDGIIGYDKQYSLDLREMSRPSGHQKRWLYFRKDSLVYDEENDVIIISDADDEDCASCADVLNEDVIIASSSTSVRNSNVDIIEISDEDCGTDSFHRNIGEIGSYKPLQSNKSGLHDQSDECNESSVSDVSEEGATSQDFDDSRDTDGSYENEDSDETDANDKNEAGSDIEAFVKNYNGHESEASDESDICNEGESFNKYNSGVNNEVRNHNTASTYHNKIIEKCKISPCKVLLSPCYDRPQVKPIVFSNGAKRDLTGCFYHENELIESATQSQKEKPFELISSYMKSDEENSLLSFSAELEIIDESDEETRNEFSLSKVDHIQLTGISPLTRSKKSRVATENCESVKYDQATSKHPTFFSNTSECDDIFHLKNASNICFKLVNDNTAKVEEKPCEIVSDQPPVLGVERKNSRILSDLYRGRIKGDAKRMSFDLSVNTEKGNRKPESGRKKISAWNNFPRSFIEGGCNVTRKYSLGEAGLCDSRRYGLIEGYGNRPCEEKERIALSNGYEQVDVANDVIKFIKDCYILLPRLDLNGYKRFQNTFIVNSKRKRKSTLFFDAEAGHFWKKKKRRKPRKIIRNKRKKETKEVKELFTESLRKINQRIRNQNLLKSLLYWEERFDLDR